MAEAIHYCDRCTQMIPPSEIDRALIIEDGYLCASCAKALSPDERAALTERTRAAKAASGERRTGPRPSTQKQRSARAPASATGRHGRVTTTPGSPRKVPQIVLLAGLGASALGGLALILLLTRGPKPPRSEGTSPVRPKAPMARVQAGPPPAQAGTSAARKTPEETRKAGDVPPRPAPRALSGPDGAARERPGASRAQGKGLVAWWKFDEPAGASTAADETGRNSAAVVGATTGVPGKIGTAYRFDGRDDHLEVPAITPANTAAQVTYAVWINISSVPRKYASIISHDEWSGGSVHFIIQGGQPQFCVGENDPEDGMADTAFTRADVGRWVHLAAAYDSAAGTVKFYRDGRPAGVWTWATARPVVIGPARMGMWKGKGRHFHGSLDDLRIYDRALGEDEIRALAGM